MIFFVRKTDDDSDFDLDSLPNGNAEMVDIRLKKLVIKQVFIVTLIPLPAVYPVHGLCTT